VPLFGAHMSISGGLHKALLLAAALDMEAVQIFTANPNTWQVKRIEAAEADYTSGGSLTKAPNQWGGKPITEEEARLFRETLRQTGLRHLLGHDSYLINLASPDEALYRKSVEAMVEEMNRAEALGLHGLVLHPGAHLDSGEEAGLARVAAALDEVHARCAGHRVRLLLETTAGQGTTLGHRFEHLAAILARVSDAGRLGVCFDTCHVFAAGYALAPEAEYRQTMQHFDRVVGLGRVEAFHLNDSRKPLGSRVDRHTHIGRGEMGAEPFRLLVNDPAFRDRAMVLETPKEEGEVTNMDEVNLTALRGLLKASRVA
jgi:deoxyribonuclease IV